MEKLDTSVHTRLSDEISRLKKTHSYVADVCNVSTKTVGRWCKNIPIPADKLELLAPHGFDVFFIIYGIRFTSLERLSRKLSEGESLDELISEFYKSVEIFRSKLTTAADREDNLSIQEESETYVNLDRKLKTSINDPTYIEKHGSHIKDYSAGSGNSMEALKALDAFVRIPLYDVTASAGAGYINGEEVSSDSMIFKEEWIHNELHNSPANLFLVHIEGDSMEPSLRAGDVVLVDHTDKANRDGIYLLRLDDALLVKRLQRLPGGKINVSSDNPSYSSFQINMSDCGEEISIIGRVIWSGRRQ